MGRSTDLRVVNPVLTRVAFDYKFPDFSGFSLFPLVGHDKSAGQIAKFGPEAFQILDTKRALRAPALRVDDSAAFVDFSITEDALERGIDDRELEDAVEPVKQKLLISSARVRRLEAQIGLGVEKAQAVLATTTGNYPSGNYTSLSGTSRWNDYTNSNPLSDIATAKNAVRSKIGVEPNTLFLSASVYEKLKSHPKLLALIQYSMKGILTADIMAEIFDVKKVVVGRTMYQSGGTFADIWGKNAVLAYVPENAVSVDEPSFGYTVRQSIYPIVDEYREERATSTIVRVRDGLAPVLVGSVAGYLIATAID